MKIEREKVGPARFPTMQSMAAGDPGLLKIRSGIVAQTGKERSPDGSKGRCANR